MSPQSYITEEMRSALGSVVSTSLSFPVDRSDIRRWAIAVYHPEPPPRRFWDEDHAATTPHGGIVAPEELNPFAWAVADPPGKLTGFRAGAPSLEAKLGLAEVPTRFMLNGGSVIDYGVPIRPGDTIRSTTTLTSYEEREGRLGLMLFTKTTDDWENQAGEAVKSTTTTIIRY